MGFEKVSFVKSDKVRKNENAFVLIDKKEIVTLNKGAMLLMKSKVTDAAFVEVHLDVENAVLGLNFLTDAEKTTDSYKLYITKTGDDQLVKINLGAGRHKPLKSLGVTSNKSLRFPFVYDDEAGFFTVSTKIDKFEDFVHAVQNEEDDTI